MIKDIIKHNFSASARHYDLYASVQQLAATELIEDITESNFERILDIGCGTGLYTACLRERFPKARIDAFDLCGSVIEIAKQKMDHRLIDFFEADAEDIRLTGKYDLITGNASFQWFNNLEDTLISFRDNMEDNALIACSLFGPQTFHELADSLAILYDRPVKISASSFIGQEKLERLFIKIFRQGKVKMRIITEEYENLTCLLKKIKYTGTRGNSSEFTAGFTPGTISKLEEIYRAKYNSITASYQIFYCRGYK